MTLYLLQVGNAVHDTVRKILIRAKDEGAARQIASLYNKGDEGAFVWLDDSLSTCDVVMALGPEGVIICDFKTGKTKGIG